MSTPETPFLLTRWTRFTPVFQTVNDDANLGDTGVQAGSFHIIGRTLVMHIEWFAGGAGVTPGTGNLVIPYPPGYSSADVDVSRMPVLEEAEETIEGQVQVPATQILAGSSKAAYCTATIATTAGVVVANELDVSIVGLITGDSLQLRIELPLKEPALPG
jgi:hypothetical protein